MGFFSRLVNFRSDSTTLANPKQWLIDYFHGGGQAKSGMTVNPDTAMRVSAVFACVSVLAETAGSCPFILYRRNADGSRARAEDRPLFWVLHQQPNPWQTPMEFKEMMTGHAALRGHAYARIDMNKKGEVTALIPLHPDRVEPVIKDERLTGYKWNRLDGQVISFLPGEIFHLSGFCGLNRISAARETIGLAMAAEEHGARLFSNGAAIRGVLEVQHELGDDAFARLKTQFENLYTGADNAGKTAILEDGVKWQQVGITNKDAEYLELRKFQVTDIARLFRVPPHLIGDLTRATFSNIEMQSLEFLTYTMMPWFTRWEEAIGRDLMGIVEQGRYFCEVLIDNFLRADIQTRYDAYQKAMGWGTSINELRRRENMNGIGPDGDRRFVSTNLVPLDQVGEIPATPPALPPARAATHSLDPDAVRQLLDDACLRAVSKEVFALKKIFNRENFQLDEVKRFYQLHQGTFTNIFAPVIRVISPRLAGGKGIRPEAFLYCSAQLFKIEEAQNKKQSLDKMLEDWLELGPWELAEQWMQKISNPLAAA